MKRNQPIKMRKMVNKRDIFDWQLRRVVKEDLELRGYKSCSRAPPYKNNLVERTHCWRRCSLSLTNSSFDRTKGFSLWRQQQLLKRYAISARNILESVRTYFKQQKPTGVMIWTAVVSDGQKSPLIFIDEVLNSRVYKRMSVMALAVSYIQKSL